MFGDKWETSVEFSTLTYMYARCEYSVVVQSASYQYLQNIFKRNHKRTIIYNNLLIFLKRRANLIRSQAVFRVLCVLLHSCANPEGKGFQSPSISQVMGFALVKLCHTDPSTGFAMAKPHPTF